LERKWSDSRVPDSSHSAIRAKLRPMVITVAFLMFFVSAAGVFLMLPLGRSGRVDFRTFYTVGYMARTGHSAEIHDPARYQEFQNDLGGPVKGLLPFNHLAYESLVYVPFSYFHYQNAYFLFLCVNMIVLAGIIYVLRPLISALSSVWSLLPLAIVVCFLPVAMALIEGQDSLILLFLFVASAVAMYRRNDFRAGALLGFSLFKFQYALPVALLFLIWKRWAFLRGFVLSAAIVLGISFWLTGFSGALLYLHSLMEVSAKYSSANGVLYGVHPEGMPNLRGIAYVFTGGSASATQLIVLVGSAVVMVWGALKRPSLPGALLTALLVSYHQVIADTSLLVLPIGLLLARGFTEISTRRHDLVLVLACVAFVGPTVLLFAGTRFYLLVLPVAALFALWDGGAVPSPKDLEMHRHRQQTDTNLSLGRPAGA
jgi:Glycosyltransferase family 87